jgi:LmbE family N-acetylglucosaminyl deacetylase
VIDIRNGLHPRRLMCLGAHSDDIEIGAGATVLRLLELYPGMEVSWVVLAAHGERREEAIKSADRFLAGAGDSQVLVEGFRERYFPYQQEIKEYFDDLAKGPQPDLVLSPWTGDAHQDHRTVGQLALNSFRASLILQYEIPKIDGDLGRPGVLVAVSRETAARKIDWIWEGFPTQHHRDWFEPETFWSLMRLRGMEARSESGYAEAFHCDRLVLAGL